MEYGGWRRTRKCRTGWKPIPESKHLLGRLDAGAHDSDYNTHAGVLFVHVLAGAPSNVTNFRISTLLFLCLAADFFGCSEHFGS